jgi:hypothetical protein
LANWAWAENGMVSSEITAMPKNVRFMQSPCLINGK